MNIPVCRAENLARTLKYLKDSGVKAVGATEKAGKPLFDADLKDPLAIVMGSEERGISAGLLARCDETVSIPVFGQISSLNVSVAASIIMYETVRQRSMGV